MFLDQRAYNRLGALMREVEVILERPSIVRVPDNGDFDPWVLLQNRSEPGCQILPRWVQARAVCLEQNP